MKNSLIVYPLLILFIFAGFSQVIIFSEFDYTYSEQIEGMTTEGNQTKDAEETYISQETDDAVFDVNMTTGLIALIIGLVAIGVVAGIRVLGSGLSDFSVKLIYKSATYYGLWGVFSLLSFQAFESIPSFGVFFWLGLTLVYSLGFFQTVQEG